MATADTATPAEVQPPDPVSLIIGTRDRGNAFCSPELPAAAAAARNQQHSSVPVLVRTHSKSFGHNQSAALQKELEDRLSICTPKRSRKRGQTGGVVSTDTPMSNKCTLPELKLAEVTPRGAKEVAEKQKKSPNSSKSNLSSFMSSLITGGRKKVTSPRKKTTAPMSVQKQQKSLGSVTERSHTKTCARSPSDPVSSYMVPKDDDVVAKSRGRGSAIEQFSRAPHHHHHERKKSVQAFEDIIASHALNRGVANGVAERDGSVNCWDASSERQYASSRRSDPSSFGATSGGGGGGGGNSGSIADGLVLSRKPSTKIRTKELCEDVKRLRDELFHLMKRVEVIEERGQAEACKRYSLWIDTRDECIKKHNEIGGAGSTRVYRCTVDGMMCAGKSMNVDMSTPYERQSFMREIEILYNLPRHPNIVRYLFHRTNKECITMFMGLYDGSLEDLIKHHKRHDMHFNASTLCHIAVSVARGVNFMHSCNVLHRDLKSGNVFLKYSRVPENEAPDRFVISEVVVGDFDVSAVKHSTLFRRRSESESYNSAASSPYSYTPPEMYDAEDEMGVLSSGEISAQNTTATTATVMQMMERFVVAADDECGTYGTPGFIAPEILDREESLSPRRYTTKVDVYAFGMLLYEMMTLETPFYDREWIHVTPAILNGELPTLPAAIFDRYTDFCELFQLCLERDTQKRISFQDLLVRLEQLYADTDFE